MATLYNVPERTVPKHYRSYFSTLNDQLEAIKEASTVYVGNISFDTPEERIYSFFSRCGPVKQVIMGVNKYTHKPCGFCFVMWESGGGVICSFESHTVAQYAVDFLSGLKIDGRPIRVEMDWGFSDGRQYGRAADGGQMRYYINDIKSRGREDDRKRDSNRDSGYRNFGNRNSGYRDSGYRDNRRRERYDRPHSDSHRRDRNDSYDNKRRRYD